MLIAEFRRKPLYTVALKTFRFQVLKFHILFKQVTTNKKASAAAEAFSISYFLFPTSCFYFTLMMMIRNVNSASDSINARPRIRNRKIPGRAPGLRASASADEAVALP